MAEAKIHEMAVLLATAYRRECLVSDIEGLSDGIAIRGQEGGEDCIRGTVITCGLRQVEIE
jgi:hypothetical protein